MVSLSKIRLIVHASVTASGGPGACVMVGLDTAAPRNMHEYIMHINVGWERPCQRTLILHPDIDIREC